MVKHSENIIFDKQEQLARIEGYCLPHETVYAVFDLKGAGTGFIGILDKRIVFYDRAFTHKKKAMVTIPYNRIHAVSSADDTGLILKRGHFATGKLTLHAGDDSFEFEFRGSDKAHQAYIMIVEHMIQ